MVRQEHHSVRLTGLPAWGRARGATSAASPAGGSSRAPRCHGLPASARHSRGIGAPRAAYSPDRWAPRSSRHGCGARQRPDRLTSGRWSCARAAAWTAKSAAIGGRRGNEQARSRRWHKRVAGPGWNPSPWLGPGQHPVGRRSCAAAAASRAQRSSPITRAPRIGSGQRRQAACGARKPAQLAASITFCVNGSPAIGAIASQIGFDAAWKAGTSMSLTSMLWLSSSSRVASLLAP